MSPSTRNNRPPAGARQTSAKRPTRKAAPVHGAPPPAPAGLDDPSLYLNRELSLLDFQRRVLEEAQDHANPLLERVRFLAIVGSNMDEFFMVRVAGLRQQIAAGVMSTSADGRSPAEQLAAVRQSAQRVLADANDCFLKQIQPALRDAGIFLLDWSELTKRQREVATRYFGEVVFPVLTPLALDPGRPFPHISNLSLNLAILVRGKDGEERFARLKVPGTLPRLVPIKRSSGGVRKDGTTPSNHYFVWLEQVIAANLGALFPGMEIVQAHPFRVTRDGDTEIQELEASDLLDTIEESIRRRRFGSVVRLAIPTSMPKSVREILIDNLEVDRKDVYVLDGPMGLSSIMQLTTINRRSLLFPPFQPATPPALDGRRNGEIFEAIQSGDIVLHHPFDSFEPVVDFLRAAARDPDVMAIKSTLYRVGRNSPVVEALLEANERHKQVAVLVELKARFDEESNIEWARALEAEGVHVVYGLLGLKTHAKVALVIRREGERIRRYVHLGTGNYNPTTARQYTDLGMFTCDEEIGADATELFNYLTGYAAEASYRKLLIAPLNLRERLEILIRREMQHQKKGRRGQLVFKVNSLVDRAVIRLLYQASQAGVKIDLLVRGMCSLRPGVPGISENIRVTSIVGRFLEHSRLYWFRNGGKEEIYLGSADLMPRNIDRRVEVLFPVQDPRLVKQVREELFGAYLADTLRARRMRPDGVYERPKVGGERSAIDSQEWLIASRKGQPGR